MSDTEWGWQADTLLDETIEREEAIEVVAEDLTVTVPLRVGAESPRAHWRFDGTVTVSIEGTRGPLAEWLSLVGEDPRPDRSAGD